MNRQALPRRNAGFNLIVVFGWLLNQNRIDVICRVAVGGGGGYVSFLGKEVPIRTKPLANETACAGSHKLRVCIKIEVDHLIPGIKRIPNAAPLHRPTAEWIKTLIRYFSRPNGSS